ncbi:hypothetical protein L1987_24479 [Smallanthus sonchifolius]|uniref:Uncharacterized protein n=1 Tax=Smallanthus sonchifolius TaxID=185202 RepID=A0ACB9ILG8_9ASTR|nr:hypothetical protein L1987_24479 [Smallanthus sonchifolius]
MVVVFKQDPVFVGNKVEMWFRSGDGVGSDEAAVIYARNDRGFSIVKKASAVVVVALAAAATVSAQEFMMAPAPSPIA